MFNIYYYLQLLIIIIIIIFIIIYNYYNVNYKYYYYYHLLLFFLIIMMIIVIYNNNNIIIIIIESFMCIFVSGEASEMKLIVQQSSWASSERCVCKRVISAGLLGRDELVGADAASWGWSPRAAAVDVQWSVSDAPSEYITESWHAHSAGCQGVAVWLLGWSVWLLGVFFPVSHMGSGPSFNYYYYYLQLFLFS